MTRARLSAVAGALGAAAAIGFFAVPPQSDERPRPPGRAPLLRDTPEVPLGFVEAAELSDFIVRRYVAAAPLTDHRPLTGSIP